MASLAQFASNMRRYADNIGRNRTKVKRTTALAVLSGVVLGTPVGNPTLWADGHAPAGYVGGRARANWFVGLGGPNKTVTTAKDSAGSATVSQGSSVIDRVGPDQPVHLTNNLPYIVPLNEGHSHQAPAGFVQQAVQQAAAKVRTMKLLES